MYKTLRFPNFRLKAVTLSYDDGVVFDKKLIEILDDYGLKCTFNLNAGLFAKVSGENRRLTQDEAVKLYANTSHEIAIHGYNHLSLGEIDSARASLDVAKDRESLESLFGRIIKGMAYANGSYSDNAVEVLKNNGINYARTVVQTGDFAIPNDWLRLPSTCHHANPNLMSYVEKFLSFQDAWNARPKLFYLWGHSYEFEDNNNWHIIENFAKEISGKDDIWYATNGEIYDYIKAYNSLIYSIDGSIITNLTNIDVYMNFNGVRVVVKAGETIKIKAINI